MSKRLLGDGTQVDMLDGIIPELLKGLSGSQISNTISQIIPKIRPIDEQRNSLVDVAQNKIVNDIRATGTEASKKLYDSNNLSAADKANNTKFGQFMSKNDSIAGIANAAAKTIGSALHSNRTGLQKSDEGALKIRDAQYSVLKKIPVTAPFAKAAEILDNTLGAITGGLGSATKADKALTAIPLVGNTAAIFAGKTDQFKGDIQDINTGDFGGVVSDATRANELSGVKSVQKNKLNNQIRAAQNNFNMTANIIDFNKRRKDNNIGSDYLSRNLSKYQGNQQLTLAKKGTKLGLDQARRLLQESKKSNNNLPSGIALNIPGNGINKAVADTINIVDKAKGGLTEKEIKDILFELTASATGNDEYKFKELVDNNKEYFVDLFNKSGYENYVELIENNDYENIYKIVQQIFNIQSFKSGGKIEKENIIPTGALHKNLHNIDDIGIDITKKGIPVVTMDEGGEFKEQIAEVEAAEWTLSLDVTKQIEEYWNNYKESGDDNIAIECGKYLVDQIFNNTRDDDKVIKKTE